MGLRYTFKCDSFKLQTKEFNLLVIDAYEMKCKQKVFQATVWE